MHFHQKDSSRMNFMHSEAFHNSLTSIHAQLEYYFYYTMNYERGTAFVSIAADRTTSTKNFLA